MVARHQNYNQIICALWPYNSLSLWNLIYFIFLQVCLSFNIHSGLFWVLCFVYIIGLSTTLSTSLSALCNLIPFHTWLPPLRWIIFPQMQNKIPKGVNSKTLVYRSCPVSISHKQTIGCSSKSRYYTIYKRGILFPKNVEVLRMLFCSRHNQSLILCVAQLQQFLSFFFSFFFFYSIASQCCCY